MKHIALISALTLASATYGSSALAVNKDNHKLAAHIINESGMTASKVLDKIEERYTGVVYAYELEEENDRFFHQVKLIDPETAYKTTLKIDIKTGAVAERSSPLNSYNELTEKQIMLEEITQTNMSVREVLHEVELSTNLVMTEVDFERDNGVSYFEIEAVGPAGEKEWSVNLESRTVTSS